MAINYRDFTWENLPLTGTPMSAANLNGMEDGIKAACDELDARPVVRAAALTSDFAGTQENTTLEDVTGLAIAAGASEVLTFELSLIYDASATSDVKIGFAVPASATMQWGVQSYLSTAGSLTAGTAANTESDTISVGAGGVGNGRLIVIYGQMTNSTTAGNLQVQIAQNTSDATAIAVKKGSILRAEVWT